MDLEGRSVNRIYSIKEKKRENRFYEIWEATSIYSANIFDFHFYKDPLSSLPDNSFEQIREAFLKVFDIQTPYLYKPFEAETFEDSFYLAYSQIKSSTLKILTDAAIIFPYEIALKIIINVLRGLTILERKNLHHTLLSPETVWLTESGRDITNIKISGFLDHYLLSSHETPELQAAHDIRNLGTLLSQMLTGKPFKKTDTVSLPGSIPSWVPDIIKTMVEDPDSFESVRALLDLFLSKAPAHSILEDSIEERIESTHKGSNETFSDGNSPLEKLEELESPEVVPSGKKIREFVSYILSFFRRKKHKDTAVEESHSTVNPQTGTEDSAEPEYTSDIQEIPSNPEVPGIDPDRPQMDPWAVDKNRYKNRIEEPPAPSVVPLQHNKAGSPSSLEDSNRYQSNSPDSKTQPEKYAAAQAIPPQKPVISAEERISMLKKHREIPDNSPVNNELPSVDPGKMMYESSPLQTEKGERKHKTEPAHTDHPVKPKAESTADTTPEAFREPPSLTLFQRFLKWLKNLFTS